MAICPYCGSQIGEKSEICGFCGRKLTLGFAAPPEEIIREIPGTETESEYEGIPDDILGSVLGSLAGRSFMTDTSPGVPAAAVIPDIPTVDEILEIPAIEETPEAPTVKAFPEIPEVEAVPDVPVVEEAPAAPAAAEVVEAPAAEEVVEAPAEERVFEAPAAEAAPVIPASQQPVYAQPAAPKKNNWMLPAVIIAVLALIGILFFAARGGGSKVDDPNLGVYKATVIEMDGMQLDADQIYTHGFTIELKPKGVCVINSDGDKGKGKWTLEGDKFVIDDNHNVITGTLSDGVLTVEDMLGLGLNLVMEKQE